MRQYILGCLLSLFSIATMAQTSADALRYSLLEVNSTARAAGVGGGLGALGADFSVLSSNPAGLATFRRSEFMFTPGFFTAQTNSTLEGDNASSFNESRNRFTFGNVGIVMATRPIASRWRTFNVGIGMNQVANFNQHFYYSGKSAGSYADRFAELANDPNGNGLAPEDLDAFEAGLAFNTGAIFDLDDIPNDNIYFWGNDFEGNPLVQKEQDVRTSGAINELIFTFAGNYEEKLMIGATLGIPFINFREEKVYRETDEDDEIDFFDELEFREDLTTSGIGINLKLGMIYRFNQMVRMGLAVHTPTAFSLTDNFSTSMDYGFTTQAGGSQLFSDESPEGTFEYRFRNPWRYQGSLGIIIQRRGFLTAEVEWVDYSASSFNLTANSSNIEDKVYQDDLNEEIEDLFTSAVNIRLGGEYAYRKLRFRAGYGITGTPYADNDLSNRTFSLGIGVREQSFYIDLAYRRTTIDSGYIPYATADLSKQQLVNNSVDNDRILMTIGFKF